MEWILLFNGISPYLYFFIMTKLYEYDSTKNPNFKVYIIAFIIQFIITTILSINSNNKRRLAKVTMINKLVQIPYFIFFISTLPFSKLNNINQLFYIFNYIVCACIVQLIVISVAVKNTHR